MADDFELDETMDGADDGEGPAADALAELAAVEEAEAADLDRLEAELSEARVALETERAAMVEAVSRYRAAVLASAPGVPADLVQGATLDEVDASLEAAKRTVAAIRSQVASELGKAEGFPVGSPARDDGDLDGLSASEKIAYGLQLHVRG